MLRYDAAWLMEWYRDEAPAMPGLPYAQIGEGGPYRVTRGKEPFRLVDVAGVKPRLDYDEPVVRLVEFDGETLYVERAVFSDGVKSNYAMDGPGELREVLRGEYGAKLPPLSDARLSNGIGTAVVVFDPDGRPYLPRRAPRQSVFPGGYHCTASGEAVWTEERDFAGLFTQNICRELEEEVGLQGTDVEWIRPVAFCREFLRAGKPQIFFAAGTKLKDEELGDRRRTAIAEQITRGRQEILDEVLAEATPEMLKRCTIECVANLKLAEKALAAAR
jgi:hypothetical protein